MPFTGILLKFSGAFEIDYGKSYGIDDIIARPYDAAARAFYLSTYSFNWLGIL